MADISTIVWSHWHIDHIGDASLFGSNVKLVVGPGFKDNFLPPYPPNIDAMILKSDIEGRELEELNFTKDVLRIGRFNAIDYFGDGSFYFLDAPGHSIGHIAALARVRSAPDSFILMAGDGCLHGGQLRPSLYAPLCAAGVPRNLRPATGPIPGKSPSESIDTNDEIQDHFYSAASNGVSHDPIDANKTIEYLQAADGRDDVSIIFSHDDTLLDIIYFFPESANNFREKGWAKKSKWVLLRDFDPKTIET